MASPTRPCTDTSTRRSPRAWRWCRSCSRTRSTRRRCRLQSGNLLDWYDPDACDIVGLDQYNHKSFNPDNRKAWRSTEDCLTIVDIAQRVLPGKPVAIAEWGVRTNPATKGAAAGWMQDFYQGALRRGVVGLSFFDSGLNVNDGGSPWTLDDTSDGTDGTERMMNAFKAVLTSEEER